MKERIVFSKDYSILFKPCLSCNTFDHLFDDCPILHYSANKDLIINKHILSHPNPRNLEFKRNKRNKSHSLKNKRILNLCFDENIKINELEKIYLTKTYKNSHSKTFSSSINDEDEFVSFDEDNEPSKDNFNKESFEKQATSDSKKKFFLKEISTSVTSIKKYDFERSFLSKLNEKRNIILNQEEIQNLLDLNLFDFSIDKPKNYSFYYPLSNFENSIKIYKKSLKKSKNREKKISYYSVRNSYENNDEIQTFSEKLFKRKIKKK